MAIDNKLALMIQAGNNVAQAQNMQGLNQALAFQSQNIPNQFNNLAKGIMDYGNNEYQKRAWDNQNALQQKELNWFDTIKQSQQNQMEAQTDYTKAQSLYQYGVNKMQNATMQNQINAFNAQNQAKEREGKFTYTTLGVAQKDPERVGYYADWLSKKPTKKTDPERVRISQVKIDKLSNLKSSVKNYFRSFFQYDPDQFGTADGKVRGFFTRIGLGTKDMSKANISLDQMKLAYKQILEHAGYAADDKTIERILKDQDTEKGSFYAMRVLAEDIVEKYNEYYRSAKLHNGVVDPEIEQDLADLKMTLDYLRSHNANKKINLQTIGQKPNGINYQPINPNPSATSNKPAPRPYPSNSMVGITKPTLMNFYHE
ncbi:hypothetical protein [Helicobacter sp. 11S02596-1]|uniref:hypothetical protein n=1 Tax=Helicobacter sp. 11S02596-1 TaxID=1476194 RepID=UPI000BA6EF30|nr:hypothetical protein [Helicobacter sp. 11S02596-1]PAF41360.1 hypothetical protein BJI48_08700 [Helicobacter sp. 11S02596-1]